MPFPPQFTMHCVGWCCFGHFWSPGGGEETDTIPAKLKRWEGASCEVQMIVKNNKKKKLSRLFRHHLCVPCRTWHLKINNKKNSLYTCSSPVNHRVAKENQALASRHLQGIHAVTSYTLFSSLLRGSDYFFFQAFKHLTLSNVLGPKQINTDAITTASDPSTFGKSPNS